jgi:hypothetical protein
MDDFLRTRAPEALLMEHPVLRLHPAPDHVARVVADPKLFTALEPIWTSVANEAAQLRAARPKEDAPSGSPAGSP